ncbi:hypothetical protein [Fusobacterium hwasookii]|jgi:hypothetical protein|uniref:Uncharacterized protein n=1 Tax=Fusobacterium hwasookii ChDC F128 TaxID=1216362 RepID=A0ABN0GXM1_9FUSO|nr:hypothetical protein [Fusobacterium hwasookii]EJU06705.1 hypothetical protein B437_11057 [Fusobacterium hwasookii ChDC F128]
MQEMEDLKDNIEVEEEEIVRKKKKFNGGLSGEAKALVEKYEKEAKLRHKTYTNMVNVNGILFVLKWVDDKPFLLPVWSVKENKKIDIEDIKKVEITEDVALLQNIIRKSEEVRASYED